MTTPTPQPTVTPTIWNDAQITEAMRETGGGSRLYIADAAMVARRVRDDALVALEADRATLTAALQQAQQRNATLEAQLAEARKWVPSHTYQSGSITFPLSEAMVRDAIEDNVWDEEGADE